MRIVLDPTRCEGHGICALFFSERIDLDTWGFAAVDGEVFTTRRLRRRALRAAAACPRGALVVEQGPLPGR